MTSYQDQPLSRREIREREARAAAAGQESADAPGDAPENEAHGSTAGDVGVRYRDYGPEGGSTPPAWTAAPLTSAEFDRAQDRADAAPTDSSAPALPDPVSFPATEGITMTRRELRALREAQERAMAAGAAPQASVPPVWAPPAASTPPVMASTPPVATDAPAAERTVEDAVVEGAGGEEAAIETAAEGTTVEESVVEEHPWAVAPADEPRIDGAPAEESPADAGETPAEDAPATEEATPAPSWFSAFAATPAAEPEPAEPQAPIGSATSFEELLAGGDAAEERSDATASAPPTWPAPASAPVTPEIPWQPPTGLVFIPPQFGAPGAAAPAEAEAQQSEAVSAGAEAPASEPEAPESAFAIFAPVLEPEADAAAPETAPAEAEPASEPTVFESSMADAPAAETPSEEAAVEQVSVEDASAEETPAEPSAPAALPSWATFSASAFTAPAAAEQLASQPPAFAEPASPEPAVVESVASVAAVWETEPAGDAAPADEPSEAPAEPGERPRNHWSRQAELDDEVQPATESLAREVGLGSATANALVLPEIPTPDIIVSPLTSTGEALVTGSMVLPQSLSATGALPAQIDESDLDHALDPGDHQVASTDSQPVRAIRAVSTHTSSREIIGTTRPKRGNRALTALIIAAAGMAVVVVTLLVVALASGVLG